MKTWGGKQKGAGRKRKSTEISHLKRAKIDFKKPLHVTLRLRAGLPSLRRKAWLNIFLKRCKRAKTFDLHILHFSLLSNHIHLLEEARDNIALKRGMCSLLISLAKRFHSQFQIRGRIFAGRFHLRAIANPTQMRRAHHYILFNLSHHRKLEPRLDDYSSAASFPDLKARIGIDKL